MLSMLMPHITFRRWVKTGLYLMLALIIFFAYVGWQLVRSAGRGGDMISVTIEQGETANQVSEKLKKLGLIRNRFWFELWLSLTRSETRLNSGTYSLPSNVNIINLTYLLIGGVQSVNEVTITIIEGWTAEQIDEYLSVNGLVQKNTFKTFVSDEDSVMRVMNKIDNDLVESIELSSLEGYLFPDTYRVYRDTSAEELASKMVGNLFARLDNTLQERIRANTYSLHELLTLASIVEREVRNPDDMAMVADIFLRRLRNNIGLQADSTVNYATGKSSPAVSASDLQIDSPYNTYKYRGLPPGPISNPGLSAIKAVLTPKTNNFWYFLTTHQGEVIYSTTFEQHKQAKARHL